MKNLKLTIRIIPTRFAKQAVFFIFFFINNIFPQVVIKERVEINPGTQTVNFMLNGCYFGNCFYNYCDSTELDLRFTPESISPGETTIMKLWGSSYEYDEDTYDILQKTITIEPECGELNYIGGGEYLFTAPDTLTADSIVILINYENYNHSCGESGSGTPGNKGQNGCLTCFPGAPSLKKHYGTGQITIKWDSLYVTAEPSELFPGDTANIIIKKRLFDGTLTDFDTSQTFEVAMLEGCILGKILVGDSLDAYFYDVNQPIKFVADTSADSTGFVLLSVGLVDAASFSKIKKVNNLRSEYCFIGEPLTDFLIAAVEVKIIDHFEITIIPDTLAEGDTLAFGETAQLIIQANDADSNDVNLPLDKLLTLKVETNETYGTFIDANGDTLTTTPVILNDISYGDANEGLIKFAAVKENPDSVVTCRVKIYLQEDTAKNGEREAVVLEQTLKIEMEEPEVQPIITSQKYDANSTAYLGAITVDNRKEFSVSLTRGGEFFGSHKFKLNSNYINTSGGHDHTNPARPDEGSNPNLTERLKRQNYGSFYSYSSGPIFITDSIKSSVVGETIMDSVCRFEYIASLWGDNMIIYLISLDNELLKDSVSIEERIPDLEVLLDGENYDLIGGTNYHTIAHNHFGAADVIQDIVQIANDWHSEFPNEEILQINDISLPNGGKFDIDGSWRGAHETHREGSDVDIRTDLYYYHQGQLHHRIGVPVRYPRTEPFNTIDGELNPNSSLIRHRKFEEICREHNGTPDIHGDNSTVEHYHIDFDN